MEILRAVQLAEWTVEQLRPACSRIEVVGSCKRLDKDEAHDIELLLILNGKAPRPEFGQKKIYSTILDKIIDDMKDKKILKEPLRKADGGKYKKFAYVEPGAPNDFCLDLFIVNEKTWGIQNVIRTGPSLFSHSFVTNKGITFFDLNTQRRYQGLLPPEFQYIKGATQIRREDEILSLPEEADAIALLGFGWIEPCNRRKYIHQTPA